MTGLALVISRQGYTKVLGELESDEIRRRRSLSSSEGADLTGEDAVVRHLLNDLVRAGVV